MKFKSLVFLMSMLNDISGKTVIIEIIEDFKIFLVLIAIGSNS